MDGKTKEGEVWGHILDVYVEQIFLGIYTVEMLIKVLSRGFMLSRFTYLRDSSNILDITVIATAYVEIAMTLTSTQPAGQKTSAIPIPMNTLRAFRVLRALKAISVVPGLKCIVSSLIESVKALRDVVILTLFTLLVFSLVGMQLLTGILQQKCIAIWPGFNRSVVFMEDEMMSFSRPVEYDFLIPPMPCEPKNLKMQMGEDGGPGWKQMEDPYVGQNQMAWYPQYAFMRNYTHTYDKWGNRINRTTSEEGLDLWAAELLECESTNLEYETLVKEGQPANAVLQDKYHRCTNLNSTVKTSIDQDYSAWINDPNNICYVAGGPLICGNNTSAGKCAAGYWGGIIIFVSFILIKRITLTFLIQLSLMFVSNRKIIRILATHHLTILVMLFFLYSD